MIEVRYAGVVVGRSAIIRELDTRSLFLSVTEPLPVGTSVVLRLGDGPGADEVEGKVEFVSESPELASAGMRVRFADPAAAALFGTPTLAPAELAPSSVVFQSAPAAAPPAPAAAPSAPAAAVARPVVASARDQAAPRAVLAAAHTAPRQAMVDDLSRGALEATPAVPQVTSGEEGDLSAGVGGESGRIPAPDPSAFGGQAGGKKNRRNRRR